ncbi:glycoside hydrolase [Pleurotus eryngii]|uniref:mannan endo-1,4-beta-mannosidase n=1 Tax=Pleurotus eryngii TaxID=5323 RepID=A0A9P6DL32_PLEER|nr:glycoside hydrolase [Pleurotus eryngii]
MSTSNKSRVPPTTISSTQTLRLLRYTKTTSRRLSAAMRTNRPFWHGNWPTNPDAEAADPWATDISAFIKSIDPNHLIALGDEGFFNRPGSPTYPYQGSEGIDFDANLQVSTLDFGTTHAYLDHWGTGADALAWGSRWITDHATSSSLYNKPVILEEFGMLEDKATIYAACDTIETSAFSGDLIWQAGSRYSWGDTHNDGYAIYPGDTVYDLMASHAATLKARP